MYEIVAGPCEQNLFTVESTVGHRTFRAVDGNYYTGVDSYDASFTCEEASCVLATVAQLIGSDLATFTSDGRSFVAEDSSGGFIDATVYGEPEVNDESVTCAACGALIHGEPPAAYVKAALAQYLATAVWSSTVTDEDGNGEPMDEDYRVTDLADSMVADAREELVNFLAENWGDVATMDPTMVGQDFWLTRCGHGTGFWDRGLGEVGDRLSASAKVYGNVDLYVGDDGQIWN